MAIAPIVISVFSVALALVSLGFAVYSWREANRPLVTVRVTTHEGGNTIISLNLLVENTGNRPAINVRLVCSEAAVKAASMRAEVPKDAARCFFSHIYIPVLANGRSASNGFWHLGAVDSWKSGASIPITVRYSDLKGREFSSKLKLLLSDDAGFAQTFWSSSTRI